MGNYFNNNSKINANQFPFNNDKVLIIMENYCLKREEILILYKEFKALDLNNNGYLSKDEFLNIIKETNDSLISIYLKFLFKIIKKEVTSELLFTEWLIGILDYINLNKYNICSFVFGLIDKDKDKVISVKDILLFCSKKKNNMYIFPINIIKFIKYIEIDRPDYITVDTFIQMIDNFEYIVYPAFRIQHELQRKYFGTEFWKKRNIKIYEYENKKERKKQNSIENNELIKNSKQLKKKSNISKLITIEYNKIIEENNKLLIKNNLFTRIKGRRNSFNNIKKSVKKVYNKIPKHNRKIFSTIILKTNYKPTKKTNIINNIYKPASIFLSKAKISIESNAKNKSDNSNSTNMKKYLQNYFK